MLLYIHIPFCDSKCFYCAFNSYTNITHLKQQYIKSLIKQLQYELKYHKIKDIETIFIGGGTPSTIDWIYYKEIFETLEKYITKDIEITIEANPNSATKKWLEGIFKLGINRISFGVQSFNNDKLKFLGRNHNETQAINAITLANEIGFKNINCDLIYDTVKDNLELLNRDLSIIQTLPINHISAYSLIVEENTPFYNKQNVQVEKIELTKHIFNQLDQMGFRQYEISNFAKNKSAQSKHNLGYWEKKNYLGIGSGAVGCINDKRYYPNTDVQEYIKNPIEYKIVENLSNEDIKLETIFLGLRSCVGVDISILNNNELKKLDILEQENKIYIKNNRFYNYDYLIADEIALFLEEF